MFKKVINPILFLPLVLFNNSLEVLSNENKGYIDVIDKTKSTLIKKNVFDIYCKFEK